MADTLHRHCDFDDFDYPQHEVSRTPDFYPRTSEDNIISAERAQIVRVQAMAQPVLQRQFQPGSSLHKQEWSMQQVALPNYGSHLPLSTNIASCDGAPIQGSWYGGAGIDNDCTWGNGLPMEPLIMPEPDGNLISSKGLRYGSTGNTQQFVGKQGPKQSVSAAPTMVTNSYALSRGRSMFPGSDFGTDVSNSPPASFFSDLSEHEQSFSTRVENGQHLPGSNWGGLDIVSHQTFKRSSSREPQLSTLEIDPRLSRSNEAVSDFDLSSLPQNGLNIAFPSVEQGQAWEPRDMNMPPTAGVDSSDMNWASSFSQTNGLGRTSWNLSYDNNVSALPYSRVHPSTNSFAYNGSCLVPQYAEQARVSGSSSMQSRSQFPPQSQSQSQSQSQLQSNQWNRLEANPPTQTRFQLSHAADVEAERKAEDKVLLEGKAAGLTYKEIKKKMRTKVAESTLRGRYRSLTKARKDRVRKPVWTENDMELLREIVFSELDRFDEGYRSLSRGQKLSKLSWKRVADFIADNGGSYHFGNSTCKKKWTEIESRR